ncbi:MAG: hypothetical protein WDN24_19100 [Sphingomonas sp.]
MRVPLIWGGAALAAIWLAASAIGAITSYSAPGVALAASPRNGFAYQQLALAHLAATGGDLRTVRIPNADAVLAREALRREPLATGAISLLGLASASAGASGSAEALFLAANRLDKREPIASGWLIERYRAAGRPDEVLRLLGDALKVRPGMTQQVMPALAIGLAQPGTTGFFRSALSRYPEWRKGFWDAVATTPAALPNAAELRARMLRDGEPLGDVDRQLVDAFVRAGRFDLAIAFSRGIPQREATRELVRDPAFADEGPLPPLDWELHSDGRIGAALNTTSGTLEITALQGTGGIVARQLIEVPPGDYLLRAKLATARLTNGAEVVIRLSCAARGAATPALVERMAGDLETRFGAAPGDCRYRWLDIEVAAIDATGAVMVRLAEVRIVPEQRIR